LWHFVVPLTASALLLVSYTPGFYYKNFLLLLIFNALFADTYRNAIFNYTIYKDVQ
ncbi:hypothetical protein V2W45_1226802, partial [Cenococcum geophilum]